MSPMEPALGRYEIQHPIGLGAYAEVFLGVARGADGFALPVAIKRVRADRADQSQLVAMLIEEAHHAARLAHPNVIAVLDLVRDAEGHPYLVMEHVDGINLGALLDAGPLPFAVAIFIVRELLAGLGYLHAPRGRGRHESGLIHRDVTPRNVLLSWAGAVKLADLGLAQLLQRTETRSEISGTPSYMAPEQTRGEALDGRSDLYAVGVVLWELLASSRLRTAVPDEGTVPARFSAIPRPSRFRQVPADLEAVAMQLLARHPDARFPTAELAAYALMRCRDAPRDGRGELLRLLDQRFPPSRRSTSYASDWLRSDRPDPSSALTRPARAPARHRAAAPAPAPRQSTRSRARSRWWLMLSLLAAGAVALALLVLW